MYDYLLKPEIRRSSSQRKGNALIGPGIDNELFFRMKKDFSGPYVTASIARAPVGELHLIIELVENRGYFNTQIAIYLADNCTTNGLCIRWTINLNWQSKISHH